MGKTLNNLLGIGLGVFLTTNTPLFANSSTLKNQINLDSTTTSIPNTSFNYHPSVPYCEGMYKDSIVIDSVYKKIPKSIWDYAKTTPEKVRYSMTYLFPGDKGMGAAFDYLFKSTSSEKKDPSFVGQTLFNLHLAANEFEKYLQNCNNKLKNPKEGKK